MYYPKNRITPTKKAIQGELTNSEGEDFLGEYFMTYDGKYFSGKYPPTNLTIPLKKIEPQTSPFSVIRTKMNNDYNIINPNLNIVGLKEPPSYYPKPTDEDYKIGKITRYFARQRKIRIFKLLEISKEVYNDINNRGGEYDYSGWDVTTVFWQISGILNDINVGGIPTKAGVIDTNSRIVKMKTRNFPGLDKYLTNFQEFYRP